MNHTLSDWLGLEMPARRELAMETLDRARAANESNHDFISFADTASIPQDLAGDLAYIPFSVKDNVETAGFDTTGGSPALRGNQAIHDASAVAALRADGALLIGKNNLHELAFGVNNNNGAFGKVFNPADPTRSAGGSSGGSAAAVAHGTVPFALGTDTGASVVVPASYCGVVGLRPSTGRYPGDGIIHLSYTRDTIGILANTVADVAAVDSVITRSAIGPQHIPDAAEITLGVPEIYWQNCHPIVADVFERTCRRLEKEGVKLESVAVPESLEAAEAGFGMVFWEAPRELGSYLAGLGYAGAPKSLADLQAGSGTDDVRATLGDLIGQPADPEEYRRATTVRAAYRRSHQHTFRESGVDALVFPSSPILPLAWTEDPTVILNGEELSIFPTYMRNVAPGGLAGAPQLTLPTSDPGELPIGVTLEGGIMSDERLLALGQALQSLV